MIAIKKKLGNISIPKKIMKFRPFTNESIKEKYYWKLVRKKDQLNG